MVTKTQEEWEAMTPDAQQAHLADEEKTVFGRTVQNEPAFERVKGQPVEKGIGSPGRETANHFAAILKYEGQDAYQAAADAIWKRDPDHAKRLGLKRRGTT
jgi:hypothetical protein